MGPVLFFGLHLGIMLLVAYKLWMIGYERGREGILTIMESGLLDRVMTGARALGGIVIGALAAQFVQVSSPLVIEMEGSALNLQTDVLDQLILGILPLFITLLTFYLLKKQFKPTTIVLILIIIGIIGGGIGILI